MLARKAQPAAAQRMGELLAEIALAEGQVMESDFCTDQLVCAAATSNLPCLSMASARRQPAARLTE